MSLKASVGPWKSSSTQRSGPSSCKRGDRPVAEAGVGVAAHRREVVVGDVAADERPDDLEGHFGVRTPGEARDRLRRKLGPEGGHIEAAVAGEPRQEHISEDRARAPGRAY